MYLLEGGEELTADDIIERSPATFFMRMGADIPEWKIYSDDILVIDKGGQDDIKVGELFVTFLNKEFRVFMKSEDGYYFKPNHSSKQKLKVWGKVTHTIRKF
ncbi:LexA family transcriptional regulator [Flammeovirga sp. SJP92]|uniref:LexA family protein n=1 Tax=Flammeovirga sp. SJP92 TaxID=1775430 RepID=UPI0007877163|nr:hypothetical protein [Flammeovirga sp. SJP92]KXX72744.1 hypothetical protein AVL50_32100 [Flammeovirga sp. SJP92]